MPVIRINVFNKIAVAERIPYICGNNDYTIQFNFDSEWNDLEVKTARFRYNGNYTDVVFSGNTCSIPVVANTSAIEVGVYSGNIKTTTPALIICSKSIRSVEGTPVAPTEDVYDQIIDILNGKQKKLIAGENITILEDGTISASGGGSGTGTVKSVNSIEPDSSGNIELGASDVHALPDSTVIPTVPTKVSAFENDAGYLKEHQSLAAYRTASEQDKIDSGKQATITDLETIRSGAKAGATALQAVPSTYRTAADQDKLDEATWAKKTSLSEKLDKTEAEETYATKSELSQKLDAPTGDKINGYIPKLVEQEDGTFLTVWSADESGGSGSGISTSMKNSLWNLIQKATYIDDVSTEKEAFVSAWGIVIKVLDSISAVDNQGTYEVGTAAQNLDLTVTATYTDGTSETVTDYTVTGTSDTVVEGSNTFTVTYKTASTTVTVTGASSGVTPVYSLASPVTFDGATLIDTNTKLTETARDWTVCFDFTPVTRATSHVLWSNNHNSSGAVKVGWGGWYLSFGVVTVSANITSNVERVVCVVTHTANTPTVTATFITASSTTPATITAENNASNNWEKNANYVSDTPVIIGADYTKTTYYPDGTMKRFEIYYETLDSDAITEWLNGGD